MRNNNNWKNPLYWLVMVVGTTAVAVSSHYFTELIEKKLKEEGLWPVKEETGKQGKSHEGW